MNNRPIDTLYYQWVLSEDEKRIPTIFSDITEMEDGEKINDILTVYASLVGELIESEVAHRAVMDDFIATATSDPGLSEEDNEDIAIAIMELEPVQECAELVENTRGALDLLHESLVRVFAFDEE